MSDKPVTSPLWMRNHYIRDAINKALLDRMDADPTIYMMGEGAGVKAIYDYPELSKRHADRIITLPISEFSNTGMQVGMALMNLKPVNNIISMDFVTRAMDMVLNTASKVNFFHQKDPKTMVIQVETLMVCATAGQKLEGWLSRIPGLRIASPSNPIDAYGLMVTALTTPGISVYIEDRMLKDSELSPLTDAASPIPFGKANLIHEGSKATVISYALTLQRSTKVVKDNNYDVDLIDLRTVYPIDWDMIRRSVTKTRNLLIVEPDIRFMGIGAEIEATMLEEQPEKIRAMRIGAPRSTIPAGVQSNKDLIPTEDLIKRSIEEMLA